MQAYPHTLTNTKKLTTAMIIALLTLLAGLGLFTPSAYADNWELFDQGEHLLLPEGPIVQDGVVMVPIRPIAERFGYTFTSVTATEVVLKDSDGNTFIVKPGKDKALHNGAETLVLQQTPRYINGNLFIPVSLAGEISGSGYSVVPGTNLIQLRPVEGDAKEKLDSLYWYTFGTTDHMVVVNNEGQVQLQSDYSFSDFGYEELVPVTKNFVSAGYMNRKGELAFTAYHYQLGGFSEGLAAFKDMVPLKDSKYQVRRMGYLNRSGQVVIPAIYDYAYDFSDGLAKVVKDGKTYYIDHTGRTAIPTLSGIQNSESFFDGLAAVRVMVKSGGKSTVKSGFINTKGQWAIKPIYESAYSFSEGITEVVLNGQIGFIDKKGNWIIKPQNYKDAGFTGQFENGYIQFFRNIGDGYKQWLMDTKGKLIAIPGADHIGAYSEGLISYEENQLYGYKNLAGDVIVKPQFTTADAFRGGAAKAMLYIKDNSYINSLINNEGKIVWQSTEE